MCILQNITTNLENDHSIFYRRERNSDVMFFVADVSFVLDTRLTIIEKLAFKPGTKITVRSQS